MCFSGLFDPSPIEYINEKIVIYFGYLIRTVVKIIKEIILDVFVIIRVEINLCLSSSYNQSQLSNEKFITKVTFVLSFYAKN